MPAHCWKPCTGGLLLLLRTDHLLLGVYCWPRTVGGLLLAACCWPPLLAAYCCRLLTAHRWPLATIHVLAAFYWPPTIGRLLLPACYWRRLLVTDFLPAGRLRLPAL